MYCLGAVLNKFHDKQQEKITATVLLRIGISACEHKGTWARNKYGNNVQRKGTV